MEAQRVRRNRRYGWVIVVKKGCFHVAAVLTGTPDLRPFVAGI